MVKQRRLGYTIATTLLLATVTACQPAQPQEQQQPTPTAPTSIRRVPTTSPTPSPTPSPSPTAHESFPPPEPGESEEIQAVRKGWEEYEIQWDRYAKDSSLNDLTQLVFTTTGQASIDVVDELASFRDAGIEQQGSVSFRNVEISEPQRNKQGYNISTITACGDFSKVKFVHTKTGEETAESKDQSWSRTIEATTIMQQNPDGRWVVSDAQGKPKQC